MTWLPGDALVVNVAGLLGEAPGSRRDLAFDGIGLNLGEDLVQDAPLSVRVRLVRTNRGLVVAGRVRTSLAETCARCLRPVSIPIDAEINEEVLPLLDLLSGVKLDQTEEPEVLRLSDHHELDLETLAREAVQLATPIAPVCRPDCPGLCPVCGEDLAGGPHDHDDEPIDPRLAALARFAAPADDESHRD